MPGLIDIATPGPTRTNVAGADVFGAGVRGYDPSLTTVNTDTDTVSAQLDTILGKDSPYITRARAGATQTANSRGLVNSSIAAGAGEAAAIDAALPIAMQDANTFSTTRLTNQGAQNTAGQFNAGETNRTSLANADALNQASNIAQSGAVETGLIGSRTEGQMRLNTQEAALGAEEQRRRETAETALQTQRGVQATELQAQRAAQEEQLIATRGEVETGLQTMRGTQARDLAVIEANYRQLMQANASAASLFNESMQQIATILRDPNTSAEQKEAAVAGVNALLESSLAVAGSISNLDLGRLLNFADTSAATLGASTTGTGDGRGAWIVNQGTSGETWASP